MSFGSDSQSTTVRKEVNETNISTTTQISGGIGVTGKDAVNLVGVAGQIASNLTAQSASVAKAQLQASTAGAASLASTGNKLTKAIGQLAGAGDNQETVIVAAVALVVVGAIVIFV